MKNEPDYLLMKCLSGSKAYGTNTPTSDTDIRGIFCAPKKSIMTPYFPVNEKVLLDEEDGKLYELTNFMKLFTDQNPNILELLYVEREDVMITTPEYEVLREAAPKLLSKKTAFTFSGFAMSQLKRIKGHDKWQNNPEQVEPPVQRDYVKLVHNYLPGNRVIDLKGKLDVMSDYCLFVPYGNNIYGVIEAANSPGLFDYQGSIRNIPYENLTETDKSIKPLLIVKYLAEEHRMAKERHKNYWTWKRNRNETRHELEVNYGYDTKHGMHIVRLMRMAEEILTEGTVNVRRKDAKELLDIRNGAWSYERMLAWAEEKDALIQGELYKHSSLPRTCDIHYAAEVLMEVQEMCWSK